MAEITAKMVQDLREKTGAGMMDCKKALNEAGGDMEKAVEVLRKSGMASASKKAGRLASEGLIDIHVEGDVAAIVEVNSETDFVAKTPDFQNFVKSVAQHVAKKRPADLAALLKQTPEGAKADFETLTKEMVAKIGENLSIRRFQVLEAAAGEKFGSYLHMGSKIGALVKVKGDAAKLNNDLLKDLAMHVAAASPRFLHREQIPADVRAKEKEIYLAQLQESGKPKEMLEKIVEGKLGKFASEVCFIEQIFVKDPTGKKSVLKHLQETDPSGQVVEFLRFQVGEGMAKKEEDFAAEVAKQLGK
ncbi:MAG TPA: translation elongation factor Ts [bacterium]|nr:translation elongation factor Ts [bacterium]